MKNIKEFMNEKIADIDPITALFSVNAAVNIGLICLTGLLSRSDNNLTKANEQALNQRIPAPSEVCSGFFDTGCYVQDKQEICDGQNTVLNFKDDVCEDVTLWSYNPTFQEFIK